jgi:hypothetical protein
LPEFLSPIAKAAGLDSFARTPEGDRRYLTNIELPGFPALSKPVLKRAASGYIDPYQSLLATAQNYAGSMAPIPKGIAELVTDRDFFQKRSLSSVTTPADMIAKSISGVEDAKAPEAVNALLRLAPFAGRELTLVKSMLDEKQGTIPERAIAAGVRTMTGLNTTAATKEEQRWDAQKQGDFLLRRYSKSFQKPVIPEDVLTTLPPDLQRVYQLNRRLDKDRADAARRAKRLGLVD